MAYVQSRGRTFNHGGIRSITGEYVRSNLIFFFFFKAFRKFPRHIKVRNNEVGQNDFLFEIWGMVKILLCFTINPRCPNTKLTTAKGERNLAS
jgi:hypothetical protein